MKKKVLMTASVYAHIRNFHLPYLKEFQRLEWETHVGCRGIGQNAPYVDKAIELSFEKKMLEPANLRATRMLRRQIRSESYDLIITHTSLAAFFTRLAVKGMKERPALINVVHGYLFDEDTPLVKRWILMAAEFLMIRETDLLIVMNEWDWQAAGKYRFGRRIERIPGMGVDYSRLDSAGAEDGLLLRKRLGIPEDAFVLIYPAEFSKRKSQHVLIEAMQYLPENVWLVLCGEGDCFSACRALAKKLRVEQHILFPGQVRDIAPWYRMADALAASSRSEGLPFNAMEAMHLGLPVIASAVKGHEDLVSDGINGFLYPYGDARTCAERVRMLLSDTALYRKFSARAVESSSCYALQDVLPKVMELFESAQYKKGEPDD